MQSGETTVPAALDTLRHLPFEDLGFAKVDHHRADPSRYARSDLGQGKTPDQVAGIATALLAKSPNLLLTRATQEMASPFRPFARKPSTSLPPALSAFGATAPFTAKAKLPPSVRAPAICRF